MSKELVNSKPKFNIPWMVIFFLIVFSVYVICPVTTSTDSRWTFYISMSMLRERNANLDEYAHLMKEGDADYRVVYLDDHIQYYFPLAIPFISVPYVWAVDTVFDLRYPTDLATYLTNHFPDEKLAKIEKVEASFISALAVVLFFLLVSLRLDRPRSILLALIFAFATPMLSTASRALWQHGLSVLCLTTALWMMVRGSPNKWRMFFIGVLLGFSYVVRPTNSLSVLFLTVHILINHRRSLASYLAGLAIPIAILIFNGLWVYHSILPPYYLPQRLGSNSLFFNALLANLISPNRGLFTSTPVFLISIYGLYLLARNGRMVLHSIEPYLAVILFTHWLIISSFDNWFGGWSLGPRFFTDMTPYLVYFLIPVFEERRLWSLRLWKVIFGTSLVLSALVHVRYATSIYPFIWNSKPDSLLVAPERLWDPLDLQVLRGTCNDKLKGKAPKCWFDPNSTK